MHHYSFATVPAVVMVFSLTASAAEGSAATSVLDKYRQNLSLTDHCIIESVHSMEFTDSTEKEPRMVTKDVVEYRADGQRLDVLVTKTMRMSGETSSTTIRDRSMWTGDMWFQSVGDGSNNPLVHMSRREYWKMEYTPVGPEAPLFGILPGDNVALDDLLRKASSLNVRPEGETGKGDNWVLEATTPNGRYKVSMDAQRGHVILTAQVHRSGHDVAYGVPLDEHKVRDDIGLQTSWQVPALASMDITYEATRIEQHGSAWVPMEAVWTVRTTYVGGRTATETHVCKRTGCEINPDFSKTDAFVPSVPEGSRVWLEWAPFVPYRWHNGRPVPEVDSDAISRIDEVTKRLMADGGAKLPLATSGALGPPSGDHSPTSTQASALKTEADKKPKGVPIAWAIAIAAALVIALAAGVYYIQRRRRGRNGTSHV